MQTGLKDKVVLITGASGGIGSEIARQFSKEGAKIGIHYNNNESGAKKVAQELQTPSQLLLGDLTSEPAVKEIFDQAEKKLGPVDILIANAGIWLEKPTPLHEMSLEQWNYTLSTNLTSIFLCTREFFRGIKKHSITEPSAVLIGSTAGIYGEAGHSDYAASKAAAIYGFLLSLKNELAILSDRGRINAICPSWVLTPIADSLMKEPTQVSKVLQTVALRKLGRPADVASAALFLASSEMSGHMSGQIITLAGGMEGRLLYEKNEIDLSRA